MDPASDWVVSGGKGALDFDGVNDFVEFGNPTVVRSGSPLFVSSWFRTATNAFQSVVAKSLLGGAAHRWWLSTNTNAVEANGTSGAGGVTASFATTYTDGNWHHLCGLYNGSVLTLFYDGLARSTATITPIEPSGFSMLIGKYNDSSGGSTGNNFRFNGQIDDVIIFNAALTANEVREIYRLGRGYGVFPEPDLDEGFAAAGFKAYWAKRQSQLIGGGL
jgi:hypothetical protein